MSYLFFIFLDLENNYLNNKIDKWSFDFTNNKPLEPSTSSAIEYEKMNEVDVLLFFYYFMQIFFFRFHYFIVV